MITQYTRLIVNKSDASIEHCISQNFPFADDWEPAVYDSVTHEAIDFEIDTDYPDVNFIMGIDQKMLRARKIIDNFEIVSGQPRLKVDAEASISAKVLRISVVKLIQETDIRVEFVNMIKIALTTAGSSEKKLLDEMRILDATTPLNLANLKTTQLIRIKSAMK